MKRHFAVLLVVLGASALACGWLEDNADVEYDTEIPVDFTIDATELCDSSSSQIDSCDGEMTTEAKMEIPLKDLEKDLDIDIVEETGKEGLRDASGRFKEITITSIDYKVAPNSLTFATPKIDIYAGPKSAGSTDDDGVFKLTTLPPVAKGTEDEGEADVSQSAESKASELFKELKLSAIPAGKPTISKGDEVPPNGKAEVELTMNVKFVANPADAAQN